MAEGRTRRMHTVPESYFEAFAVNDLKRRTSGIWRFDRRSGEAKILGVGDAEVAKDLYTLFTDDNTPDTSIEDELLCELEGRFCTARTAALRKREPSSKEQWTGLARFVAAQMLRTPRVFQQMQDLLNRDRTPSGPDTLQRVMVVLIKRWIPRLLRMNGALVYNDTDMPLLTSDNPVVMWKKKGDNRLIIGVDQFDKDLVVSCPLSPGLMFRAYQTQESLEAVYAEQHDIPPFAREKDVFRTYITGELFPEEEVAAMNRLCLGNAHRYVYANYCDDALLKFLHKEFFGAPGPVRGWDRQPIGSSFTSGPL